MKYLTATFDELLEHAQENGNVAFLKKLVAKDSKISFLELKRKYYEKYLPAELPKPKAKQKTFREILNELD